MDRLNLFQARKIYIFHAFFIFCVFVCASGAHALQIEIKERISIDDDGITLGDVANLSPVTPRLEKLRLGRSPSAGKSRTLDRAFIARALQRSGVNPQNIAWSGADAAKVTRTGRHISTADIMTTIENYVAKERNLLPDVDIRFEPYSEPEEFVVPEGKLQVEVIPGANNILSSRSLTLVYRVDGRVVNNLTVRGTMTAEAEVVVADTRIRRGTTISRSDVKLIRTEIDDSTEPVFSLAEVVGMELTRSVRAGDPMDREHVQPPVVVERGAFVQIIAERGSMRLEATGAAREDGRLGETIRVRNSSSLEEVRAEVIGSNTVKVRF